MASPSASIPNKGLIWAIKWLLILSVITLLVDLYCTAVVWAPNGLDRLQQLIATELNYIGGRNTFVGDGEDSTKFAVKVANGLYSGMFVASGIHEAGMQFAKPESVDGPGTSMRKLFITWDLQIKTAMLGLQLFGIRLGVLILTLPLFLLAGLAGLADGGCERAIRKACGGRESSFLYHRFKHGLYMSFILMWGVYLCIPVAMDPKWVLPPFALAFGVSIRFMAAWFKKYL